jgi:signal transduction histidine kinase/ActR/RegA family two-component response regulator
VPARAFRRELRASYFAPFLAIALLAGVVLWRVSAQVSRVSWVVHSYQVIRETREAQADLLKMTVAIRSYWLSAEKRYLAKLQDSERDLDASLARLSGLVGDNPVQGRRLLEASSLKGTWVGEFETLIAQRNSGQTATLPLSHLDDQTQAVSRVLDEVVAEEDRLLNQRSAGQRSEDRLLFLLVPLLYVLTAVILSYWGWYEIGRASRRFAAAVTSAKEASRAKDNFLATVSHELRNPLNSIMLSSGILLSDQELQENVRQKVRAIERAARTQAQLIEDLLDVSRIESGRMRLDVQATDLAQVVKAAVDAMRVAAEAKSIDLQEIIDPSVNLIAGDPQRLEQVVWNLLSNAVKFTPKRGKVQVRLERINSHVEIVVSDNGQGIAPPALYHVFDRFWRETDSDQSRPGTGLGLSIVKELVTLHGGTVIAHSDGVGKGSTFTVRLPLPVSTAPLLEPRRHPTVAPLENVAAASRLDGLSILVVDDDPEACDALAKLFDSLGATVSAATSAQAALGKLDGIRHDAIVADIGMPVEDGFFFAREVRKREQHGSINGRVPLVALTAYGRVEDKIKILASGFDSHVVKPVELGELSAIIRSLVAARGAS